MKIIKLTESRLNEFNNSVSHYEDILGKDILTGAEAETLRSLLMKLCMVPEKVEKLLV